MKLYFRRHSGQIIYNFSRLCYRVPHVKFQRIRRWRSGFKKETQIANFHIEALWYRNCQTYQGNNKPKEPLPSITYDLVGPKDEKSNIRHMVFIRRLNETKKEKQLRELQEEMNKWHHSFWTEHNQHFSQSKKMFLSSRSHGNSQQEKGRADELSVFYKDFLDRNYKTHMMYQKKWYKSNFQILWLSVIVNVQRAFRKIFPNMRQE